MAFSFFRSPTDLVGTPFLILTLTWAEQRSRFRQTLLGPLWHVLQPIAASTAISAVFSRFLGRPGDFPFYFSGFLIWSCFTQIASTVGGTFAVYGGLYKRIYFPRIALPIALVLSKLPWIGLQTLICAYIEVPTWYWVPALTLTIFFAFGVGLVLAAGSARYQDLQLAMNPLFQLAMLACPILYSEKTLVERGGPAIHLNPLVVAISAIRNTTPLSWSAWGISILSTLSVFALALLLFHRAQTEAADAV